MRKKYNIFFVNTSFFFNISILKKYTIVVNKQQEGSYLYFYENFQRNQ